METTATTETGQPMRLFCKANPALNAAVRGDKVILVSANASDKSQHWIQDYSAVGNLTDDEGGKAFALVNRTTGQAMVNTFDEREVQLAPYSGHVAVELPMLWSLGEQRADGFSTVKVLQQTNFIPNHILNALRGYPVEEGKIVGTYRPHGHDLEHTLWKIVPINEE